MSASSPVTLHMDPFFEMSLIDKPFLPPPATTSMVNRPSPAVSESSPTTSESAPKSSELPLKPIDKRLFFKIHELEVVQNIMKASSKTAFPLAIAELIATYVTSNENLFGIKEWKEYLDADIDETEPPIPTTIYKFLFSKDPLIKNQDPLNPILNCDTHFPLVLVPKKITYAKNTHDKEPHPYRVIHLYYLLKKLGKKPNRSNIPFPPKIDLINKYELTHVGMPGIKGHAHSQEPTRWVILREGAYRIPDKINAFSEMRDFNKTHSTDYECYDEEQIDITTVIFTNYVRTGKLTATFKLSSNESDIIALSNALYPSERNKRFFLLKKIIQKQIEENTDCCGCVIQ